jgi:hypothetical protein
MQHCEPYTNPSRAPEVRDDAFALLQVDAGMAPGSTPVGHAQVAVPGVADLRSSGREDVTGSAG